MDVQFVVLLIVCPLVMVLAAVFAHAGATGRLRRNHLVGIRLPWTLASDSNWRAGHRAAVLPAWGGAAATGIADVVAVSIGGDGDGDGDEVLVGLIVVLALALLWVGIAAGRAAITDGNHR